MTEGITKKKDALRKRVQKHPEKLTTKTNSAQITTFFISRFKIRSPNYYSYFCRNVF